MAEKVQTIKEIRQRLTGLVALHTSPREAGAIATVIIEEFTGMGGARQMAFGTETVDDSTATMIFAAAERAVSGEPLQYILGYTLFCGHRIEVAPGVLIPRPETEELTSIIISENRGFSGIATDLCTGSGCMAISVSCEFPDAKVYATDLSDTALHFTAHNADINNVSLNIFKADLLKAPVEMFPICNMIFSNPPYVLESEAVLMHKNVVEHEPHEALFVPDNDPLIFYRSIAVLAGHRLLKNGRLYLEINESLGKELTQLFTDKGFRDIKILEDIKGKQRFLTAKKQ